MRIKQCCLLADTFVYVVSSLGVTGQRDIVNSLLPALLKRIRIHTNLPLAVGFGVSTRAHLDEISKEAEGVVVGSKIIQLLKDAGLLSRSCSLLLIERGKGAQSVCEYAKIMTCPPHLHHFEAAASVPPLSTPLSSCSLPNGRFGEFGGQFAPETLMNALDDLEKVRRWRGSRMVQPFAGFPPSLLYLHPGFSRRKSES